MNPDNTTAPRILIIAGGTGGHIVPGMAVAFAMQSRSSVVFLSAERNRDFADFQNANWPMEYYHPPRIQMRFWLWPRFFWQLARALLTVRTVVRRYAITACIGMGGYSSLPALLYARLTGIPYYLCEQNAVAGRVTRLFAHRARGLFLGFPLDANSSFRPHPDRTQISGNPLKPVLAQRIKDGSNSRRDSKARALSILVLGGSQGAKQINEMCLELFGLPDYTAAAWSKHLHWDLQCGAGHVADLQGRLLPGTNCNLFGYHPDISDLLTKADILIARSGAGVLGEACAFGLPMILIPYPWSQDGHQQANAHYLESQKAALVIDSTDTNPQALLGFLQRLVTEPELRSTMAKNAGLLARPNAASDISAAICQDLAHDR
ncbi:MAG: UDP-N-acetylglucosamine--N-acetylmuramyl-(pentapeptide) pyrophosphoryl-undecaprenol N-acetylglucosamine transferase [Leptospiraceae bacterium]|nr:UDP-N-acetylglucosamine--N-acetylmuramyl-(pentapeptide) pyrophosphoryl-undecaprenol N-acetylglucosamine transferase [Leptospiraceae bacterium]